MSDLDEILDIKPKHNNIYANAMSKLDIQNKTMSKLDIQTKTYSKPIKGNHRLLSKIGTKLETTPSSEINKMPFIQSSKNSAGGIDDQIEKT
jgi:hypothetical protein